MSERSDTLAAPPVSPSRASRLFLMAGGGTGGHVIPGLAVAAELRARGHQAFFVGTARGLETSLVPARGFELELVRVGALKGVGPRRIVNTLFELPPAILQCARWIRRRGVAAVFSMGGYAAGPPVLAALALGVPLVVMEPNAVPGFTNRRIGRWVSRALVSFPETARYFGAGKTVVVGLPVREEFFRLPPKPPGDRFTVLITGGSQGSRTLNNAARESWPLFGEAALPVELLHQAGRQQHEELAAAFRETGLAGEVVPFLADMPAAFARADLVICRSGAGAVAELAAAGKPSVLVPFPFAADQHQLKNAEAFGSAGAARVILDSEMTGAALFAAVSELARDRGRLEEMGKTARRLARPGAARRAADILEEQAARLCH